MTAGRILAILFTDLVGSTALSDRLGDEAAEALRRAHHDVLREAIADHEGEEVKSTGDGVMAVFPSAADAVGCAVAMQQGIHRANRPGSELALRVGIHVGEPIAHEADYYGTSVNVAHRLCEQAPGGAIHVSDVVRALTAGRPGVELRPLGPRSLRGIAEPLTAFEVVWTPAATTVDLAPPLRALPRYPFVARTAERVAIRDAWKRAASGERRALFLGGEPGIGKTRLAREFAIDAHGDGATVLYGRCDVEMALPYQPIVEALRAFVGACGTREVRELAGAGAGELARLVPDERLAQPARPDGRAGEGEPYRLFHAVDGLLTRASRIAPVLLICDDLQWADRPTLALLKHVLRSPEPAAIMVLATYRDVEVGRTHPLSELVLQMHRDGLSERLDLRGLEVEDVIALLERAAEHAMDDGGRAFAHALHDRTNGNPFYIEEILLDLVESGGLYLSGDRWTSDARNPTELAIPATIRDAIGHRLARLSPASADVVTRASVLGPSFMVRDLAEILRAEEPTLVAALDEAVEAQLLADAQVPGQTAYTFAHALVREVLYDSLPAGTRRRLHLNAATALERRADAPHGAVAVHYREAGDAADPDVAVAAMVRAASAAGEVFAYAEAATQLRAAVERLDETDGDLSLRARLRAQLGDLQFIAGLDYATGIRWLEESHRMYEGLGDEFRAAQALSRLGRAYSTFDTWMDIDRALEYFRAAEAALARYPESAALGHTYIGLASAAIYAVRSDEGLAAAERALEIARSIGNRGLEATAVAIAGWHTWAGGRLAAGERMLEEGWERADELDHPTLGFISTWMQILVHEMVLSPGPGAAVTERELAKPRAAAAPTQRVILRLHRDMLNAMGGNVRGLRDAHEAVGADEVVTAAIREQFDAYHRGDWQRCEALCRDAYSHRLDAANRLELCLTSHTLGWTLRLQDRLPEAASTMLACLDATAGRLLAAELIERSEAAVAAAAEGRVDEGRALVERCAAIVGNGEDWRGRAAAVDWAGGVVECAAGGAFDAAFARAVEGYARHGAALEEAEANHWWAKALASRGEAVGAADRRDRAISIYERAGVGDAFIERVAHTTR